SSPSSSGQPSPSGDRGCLPKKADKMPIVRIYTSSGPGSGGGGLHGEIVNERFILRSVPVSRNVKLRPR
ncbi:MAG: hypothetical protein MUP41_17835, partial [Desulfobacterales bacterium]|nr:hypothetical protein [Desulfobacterales bacterium]